MFVHRGTLQSFASGLVQVGRLSPSGPMPGTPAGVALARLVGESLGTFASVVTSASPRAIETAVAMGFAVHDVAELPSGVRAPAEWPVARHARA
jgi:broad specificity phosphatase PhoE